MLDEVSKLPVGDVPGGIIDMRPVRAAAARTRFANSAAPA